MLKGLFSARSRQRELPQPRRFDLTFRVLGYKEDGVFVAHALEPDIVACGDSPDNALQELLEALEAQISFALEKEDFSLLEGNSPPELMRRWETLHREMLAEQIQRDRSRVERGQYLDAEYVGFSTREISALRPFRPTLAGAH